MTTVEELLLLADDAAQAKADLLDKSIQRPVEALSEACKEAARAWSGSNIGYHATVYYHDLQPKPPSVQFSAEWGIEELWPTNMPDEGWEMMDHQAVVDAIIAQAGGFDLSEIDKVLRAIRQRLFHLKDNVTSILSAHTSAWPDKLLATKLAEMEALRAPTGQTIARGMLPSKYWSRDSLAMTQGLRASPHQVLSGFASSAKYLELAIDKLENATRLSAAHIRRLEQQQPHKAEGGMGIFDMCNERVTIERQDATRHENVAASVTEKMILIPDKTIPIAAGDAILRLIPSGLVERLIVTDPGYHAGISGAIAGHYQVKYRREGQASPEKPGYIVHVTGDNSRVNIHSADNSSNAVIHQTQDMSKLEEELRELREVLIGRAQNPEHYVAIGAIASAEVAAKSGEQSKVTQALSALGTAGKWALNTATEIGVKVATEALKAQVGL